MSIIIYDNGVYREPTEDDLKEWSQLEKTYPDIPEQPPTVEDRVQILEEAIELLLSGATE